MAKNEVTQILNSNPPFQNIIKWAREELDNAEKSYINKEWLRTNLYLHNVDTYLKLCKRIVDDNVEGAP